MKHRWIVLPALFLSSLVTSWAGTGIHYVPLPTSHHFARENMGFFYHKENGGLELLTGIPYQELPCKNCHQKSGKLANGKALPYAYRPSCEDCHDFQQQTSVKSPDICLECHTRQNAEMAYFKGLPEPKDLDWQDIHFREGMTCTSCHTGDQLHDDATGQLSMLDPKGTDARCEDCHEPQRISPQNHALHGDRVACVTCHIKSVFTCNNCHFETELATQGKLKRVIGQERGFMLLVNRRGYGPRGNDQVHPATFQSLTYNGRSFNTIAPFFSHTVMKKAHDCGYCHDNAALKEYASSGQITVTKWDEGKNKPVAASGMIPVPPDWQRALRFDYADFKGDLTKPGQPDKWVFLKSHADLLQMVSQFAYPLTDAQLDKLRVPVADLPIAKMKALRAWGIVLPEVQPGTLRGAQPATPRVSPLKPR
jgi:hypothetical protein